MFRNVIRLLVVALLFSALPAQAADCQKALVAIFSNEGGFQKLRGDSGNWTGGKVGVGKLVGTKYGICAASYPKVDIPNLTLAQAARYYERDFWGPLRLTELKSQAIATTILDTAVNCGTGTAAILVARSINLLNGLEEDAPVDPVLTGREITWLNDYTRTQVNSHGEKDRSRRQVFYAVFQALRSYRYVAIAQRDRNKRQFLSTWLLRTWQ